MNFKGTLTIQHQVFNPRVTLLEWTGPNGLSRFEHVLTGNLGAEIVNFLLEVEQLIQKGKQ